jgi:class 3 adenylate cyclase
MVKEIIAQGGYIDKFMGDAVMAVFRDEYHLDRAIDAALSVRTLLQNNAEPLPEGITFRPDVAIGISTGEVVSGNIGSASLKRLDYTIIGDVVNLGQRLQSVAHPGQILITDTTYERVKESFQCQPVQEFTLKNKSQPVMTYEVIS